MLCTCWPSRGLISECVSLFRLLIPCWLLQSYHLFICHTICRISCTRHFSCAVSLHTFHLHTLPCYPGVELGLCMCSAILVGLQRNTSHNAAANNTKVCGKLISRPEEHRSNAGSQRDGVHTHIKQDACLAGAGRSKSKAERKVRPLGALKEPVWLAFTP